MKLNTNYAEIASLECSLPATNQYFAIAFPHPIHQNGHAIMHKTKGIPYHPRTGNVLMRLVYCDVLSNAKQTYSLCVSKYYKINMKNHIMIPFSLKLENEEL